jgi:glutaredoxin
VRARLVGVAVVMTLLTGALPACRHRTQVVDAGAEAAPVVVKEDSVGLLLTWIDEKGDFHVEQKVADVPLVGRDAVRVIDPMREDDGTRSDRIFVADLRTASPDGTYPVRVTTRAEFETLAETRRQKQGLTLASAAPPSPDAGPMGGLPSGPQSELPSMPTPSGTARPAVIIYGASWCGPCHQAADYLRKKGVAFVLKDIENDPDAAREMRAKLAHAGIHTGSIPVIDIRGKVLVGFSAQSVDEALGRAL